MTNFTDFYQLISKGALSHWLNTLPAQLSNWQHISIHGKCKQWFNIVDQLPVMKPTNLDLLHGVNAQCTPPLSTNQQANIENLLRQLMPWRKGPFSLFNIIIDAEWRSDWKWERIVPHIIPLTGRLVLDVGCGNGYYLWRMLGAGAQLAVGIDPMQLFYCQFEAVRKLFGSNLPAYLLPLGLEQLVNLAAFDTVFSMGVLYHRRSPINHLLQLKNQLVSGGELVLETLIIKGHEHQQVLVPSKSYAKMRNVYFIPSTTVLICWLEECGFINVRQVNISITSTEEQRSTTWMANNSLGDFLSPGNPSLTLEGYPAPLRAVIIAEKP